LADSTGTDPSPST